MTQLPPSQLNSLASAAQYYAYIQSLDSDTDERSVVLSTAIHQAGRILNIDQPVTSIAIILFHRYVILNASNARDKGYSQGLRAAAAAALFISLKKEQKYTSLALEPLHVLAVYNHVLANPTLLFGPQKTEIKQQATDTNAAKEVTLPELYTAEMELLASMSFSTQVVLAFSLALSYIQVLQLDSHGSKNDTSFSNAVYTLINTATLAAAPSLYNVHQPNTIATVAIYLAAAELQMPVTEDTEWWQVFDVQSEDFGHCLVMVCSALERLKQLSEKSPSELVGL